MYSQNDEEAHILAHLPPSGRLLDIGAYDGKIFSNSRALLEKGWLGVLVEPSPVTFVELMRNTEEFKENVTLINAAITAGPSSIIEFYDSMGDAISGYDPAHLTKWKGHLTWRPMKIQTMNLMAMLDVVGTDFDFVTIDTEGTNMEILEAMPWQDMHEVRMICVEYDGKHEQMKRHVEQFGFNLIHRNGENLIFNRVVNG